MRLKVEIDVRRPLKRKKKVCKKNKSTFVVNCKYERLGDFCFMCGLMSHTEIFCRRNMDNRSIEAVKEWGHWLRAPPCRAAGVGRSKWLRDEGDAEWEFKLGNDNHKEQFSGNSSMSGEKEADQGCDIRRKDKAGAKTLGQPKFILEKINVEAANSNNRNYSGPEEDELDGLSLEERKRKRCGPF